MPTSVPPLPDVNLVDVLVALVILLYVLDDWRRGVLCGLLDLVGLGLSLLAALRLYSPLAGLLVAQIGLAYALAKPAAFAAIWIGADVLFGLTVRRALANPASQVARSLLGRLLGVATGLLRGTLVSMLALAVVTALPVPEQVQQTVQESRVASYLGERTAALQRALSAVLGEAVQETLAMLTVKPESDERVELRFRVADPPFDETAEGRMLELVNGERARAGLPPLSPDPAIRDVARGYSAEMLRRGFFSHIDLEGGSPFERMRRGGVRFAAAGENLALAPTVQIAHDGLMNSPGHRANILNSRFRRVGIGVADAGLHGKMFTQNFAD